MIFSSQIQITPNSLGLDMKKQATREISIVSVFVSAIILDMCFSTSWAKNCEFQFSFIVVCQQTSRLKFFNMIQVRSSNRLIFLSQMYFDRKEDA